MAKTSYRNLSIGLLSTWFVVSLTASAFNFFKNVSTTPPLAFLFAVTSPVVIFAIWYNTSASFREFVLSLNPKWLTFSHIWRVNGFIFLILMSRGLLPAEFAKPAGWGDILIGATASLVAFKFANAAHRNSFILWQALGMADLLTAVVSGAGVRIFQPTASMAPMTVLPLSLIPTFLVPLFFIFHIICIAQAKRWSNSPNYNRPSKLAANTI